MDAYLVLNERDAAQARNALGRTEAALSASRAIQLAALGLSPTLVERHASMLKARQIVLTKALDDYGAFRKGEADVTSRWQHEPGVMLVIARIARGLSQRELASKMGMREQQIQRYESDYYSTISLSNLKKFAAFLNVDLRATLKPPSETSTNNLLPRLDDASSKEVRRIASFALDNGWLPASLLSSADTDVTVALMQYVGSARDRFGSPALLRTGLNSKDYSKDLSLLTWRTRASEIALTATRDLDAAFDPTEISWLKALVQASPHADGPKRAERILRDHGIAMIIVPQSPGLRLDGAAFFDHGAPVIALTLRYDRVDSFWFTLLHELGHVFLHLHSGLELGFYDDVEHTNRDEAEIEANDFAKACIISDEVWRTSPARISNNPKAIERLAETLNINPALLFGRIRNERANYKIFTEYVGQGSVRRFWQVHSEDPSDVSTDD